MLVSGGRRSALCAPAGPFSPCWQAVAGHWRRVPSRGRGKQLLRGRSHAVERSYVLQGPIKHGGGTGFGEKRQRQCSICRRAAAVLVTHAHRPIGNCHFAHAALLYSVAKGKLINQSVRKESKLWCVRVTA